MRATFIPRQISTACSRPSLTSSVPIEFKIQRKLAKTTNATISETREIWLSCIILWKTSLFSDIFSDEIEFSAKLMKFVIRTSPVFESFNWNWDGHRVSIQAIWDEELIISYSRVRKGLNSQSRHLKIVIFLTKCFLFNDRSYKNAWAEAKPAGRSSGTKRPGSGQKRGYFQRTMVNGKLNFLVWKCLMYLSDRIKMGNSTPFPNSSTIKLALSKESSHFLAAQFSKLHKKQLQRIQLLMKDILITSIFFHLIDSAIFPFVDVALTSSLSARALRRRPIPKRENSKKARKISDQSGSRRLFGITF